MSDRKDGVVTADDVDEVQETGYAQGSRVVHGMCSEKECAARQKIIFDIIRAKRDAGFSRDCNFFQDVWPVALAALKEKREREGKA